MQKRFKFTKILIAVIFAISIVMCLAACSENEPAHEHSYVDGTCSCGAKNPNYVAPHTHTPAEAIIENIVDATCTQEGGYDEVVKCSDCGEEISRTSKVIEKLDHTPAEATRENVVEATCTATGSYEEVIKCSLCGEELSRTAKVIEKLDHTPGEATRENVVEATCTATGSYEEVIKCSLCGEELSRTSKVIEKLAHTPAEAIIENVTYATCAKDGSYDEIINCSVCGEELSKTTNTISKLDEHEYSKGICTVCGAEAPDYSPDAVYCQTCPSTRYTETVITEAGVFSDGEIIFTCSTCSHSYSEVIPATKTVKVLIIGDNSTLGEITYLDPILREAGVENILIATLNHNHSKGATIDSQWANISSNKKAYTLMTQLNGTSSYAYSKRFSEGLSYEDWDFIIIGQAVTLGGDMDSFAHLSDYASHIKENASNPKMKLLWNMSWALSNNSSLEEFAKYENSRAKMFEAIISATKAFVASYTDIDGILPIGTAIENLRATVLGDTFTNSGILLGGTSGDCGVYAASLILASEILSMDVDSFEYLPEAATKRASNIYSMAKEAAELAIESKLEINAPECKTMKLLIMGNSYGNDAMAYFEKILHDAGYIHVVIGHMGESSMAINDHYHNIDDDPTNDYIYKSTGNTFSVHYKMVDGVRVELEADYKKIIANEDWDIITFYQGPNSMDTLVKEEYYSELNNLLSAIKANMTNPNGKIIYYMPWVHGSDNTAGYYAQLSALTDKLFIENELVDGIIPAGTVIQNLRTSYLSSATDGTGDINRDWGHLNYGVGRYAVALTFYAYLTGGDINDITYIPTKDEASLPFTDPALHLDVIREAIQNALDNPFEITASEYTEKP